MIKCYLIDVDNDQRATICVGDKLSFVKVSAINYQKKLLVAKGGKVYRFK